MHKNQPVSRQFRESLKNPKSKVFVSDFKNFTQHSYHLLNDLATDSMNTVHCIGLASGMLGFDSSKLNELAQPFLRTAAYYSTAADTFLELNTIFNKKGLGDIKQSISAFHFGTGNVFSELPNKVTLLDTRLTNAEDNLEAVAAFIGADEEANRTWSKIFNGASTIALDNSSISETSQTSTYTEADTAHISSTSDTTANRTALRTINTLQHTVQFFGILMKAFGKSDIAEHVTAIVAPTLTIATTLATWGTIVTTSGPAAPYVAIAGALVILGMAIANLLSGPSGPTRDEIIMQQFEHLSIHIDFRFDRMEKFIESLAKHLDVRFEELRQLLQNSHQIIVEMISQLHQDMNNGFITVLRKIKDIESSLSTIAKRHNALFADLYMQDFNKLLESSIQSTSRQLGQGLDASDKSARRTYLNYYTDFYSMLTDAAANDILSGSSTLTNGEETHELVDALIRAFNPQNCLGYESSINSIATYAHKIDSKINFKRLVNPLVWSNGVIAFIRFVVNNPGFHYGHSTLTTDAKKQQHAELKNIIEKGNAIKDFLTTCQASKDLWDGLISNYTQALREFVIELYCVQWPSTPQSQVSNEDAVTTLEHVAALKMLPTALDDYINSHAGPAPNENLFQRTVNLPSELTTQFPNPGKDIIPGILVNILRASEVRFHNAYCMRTFGREILRNYLGVAVPDESNGACEDALKRAHGDLKEGINKVRDDSSPGGTLDYPFAKNIKQGIVNHQNNWNSVMQELRNLPTTLKDNAQQAFRKKYVATLLRNTTTRFCHAASNTDNSPLPDRELLRKAYAVNQNSSLPQLDLHNTLNQKLTALDEHAFLLKFFMHLLFSNHPELIAHFKHMLWDRARVTRYSQQDMPIAITLHNLLEREHPRLLTYLEIFTKEILHKVDILRAQKNPDTQIKYIEPNVAHVLATLSQFEALYFKIGATSKPTFDRSESDYRTPKFSNDPTSLGFRIIEVSGDGNCFFRAISALLSEWKMESMDYQAIRQAAVEYLQNHRNLPGLQEAFTMQSTGKPQERFEDYCSHMRIDGTWAEGIIITATALMLNVTLALYDYVGEHDEPYIMFINDSPRKNVTFSLSRSGPINSEHYNALIPTVMPQKTKSNSDKNINTKTNKIASNRYGIFTRKTLKSTPPENKKTIRTISIPRMPKRSSITKMVT
jgi:hypothetical protein